MIRVRVNGEAMNLDAGTTVAALVVRLRGDAGQGGVAVAVNEEVVPRGRWATTELPENGRVEILTPAQGG